MDMSISDLPISRPGQKDPAANVNYHTGKLGKKVQLIDIDWSTPPFNELSSMPVFAIFVLNAGSALVPGTVAKWSIPGTTVNGNAVANEVGAGIVDPFLTANVATNEKFLLFVEGPTLVRVAAALAAGTAIKNVASGNVDTNPRSVVGDVISSVGVMLAASSGANQLRRANVSFDIK